MVNDRPAYADEIRADLMDEIDKRESLMCCDNLLNGISMYPFQAKDVMKGLFAKRAIYRYDTGMGKTVIMSGLIKARHNVNPLGKTIVFVTNAQLKQTVEDIKNWTGLKVSGLSGTQEDLSSALGIFDSVDVLLLTSSVLQNFQFLMKLHKRKELIDMLILDEVHELSNIDDSDRSIVLKAITEQVEFVYSLTATPITTGKQQLPEIMTLTNPFLGIPMKTLIKDISVDPYSFLDEYRYLIFDRNRASVGASTNIIPKLVFVKPMDNQIGANGSDMFTITKGPGSTNQYEAIEKILKDNIAKGNTGLIFAWHHIVVDGLKTYFFEKGYRIGYLTGRDNDKKCAEVISKFKNGEYDAVITSKTTALNLDCDYVVMFEMTTKYKQMIGRAHRGLNPKTLPVYFIFTEQTAEFSFFRRRIYQPALFIDLLIGTSFEEIYRVYKIIEFRDIEYDIEIEDKRKAFFEKIGK